MGRFFGTRIYQWQVVTGRIVVAHQPPRAIRSSISSSGQADVGHSDILSGSWNFSDTNLSHYGVANLSVEALSRGQESKKWFLNPQVVIRVHRWISSHHASRLTFQYISSYTGRTGEQRDQCSGSEVEVHEEV